MRVDIGPDCCCILWYHSTVTSTFILNGNDSQVQIVVSRVARICPHSKILLGRIAFFISSQVIALITVYSAA